jgi:hypothetical protein
MTTTTKTTETLEQSIARRDYAAHSPHDAVRYVDEQVAVAEAPRNTEKNVSQWIRTELRGQTNPITVAACKSCGAFCSVEGGSIRHARSCESGLKSELWTPATVAAPLDNRLPLNTVGNGEAEDKWHAVNSRNPKDWDRAMNRDD